MRRLIVGFLLVWTTLLVEGQQPPDATRAFSPSGGAYVPSLTPLAASTSELRDVVGRFDTDRQTLLRFYTIPGSAARRERLRTLYDAWLERLAALDFERLSLEGRVDHVLLRTRVEYERALLGREERIGSEIGPVIPFEPAIIELQEARQKLQFVPPDAAAGALERLTAQVLATHEQVKAAGTAGAAGVTPLGAVRAAERLDLLRRTLSEWFRFYNGYDPAFTAKVPKLQEALTRALTDYAAFLREKVAGLPPGAGQLAEEEGGRARGNEATVRSSEGPIIGDAIGRDGLFEDLRGEMIPYTPEELIEIGNREYVWCENEMKRAAREMGFGDDWKAALEKVKRVYVPRGDQPRLIRNLALEAIAFIKQRDLITIPPLAEDTWRMSMMTPERMRVNPFFLGGETIQVSYPTNAMAEEDSLMIMRGNGPHLSRATVFHELIPGHGLQGFMAARYNAHRSLFRTPFYSEGWALYWEMVLWDAGFPRGPEDRVGMLFWRMHRAARIIFSLSFHLGRWTPQQCVDFLVDKVGHERLTAEGEVRRSFNGSYSPLYQVAYMMGALQLRALARELVDTGVMTPRAFNDAVLHEGPMPIEMLRVALGGRPLARDHQASWRFYGEVSPGDQPR